MRDRYGGGEIERLKKILAEKAKKAKKEVTKDQWSRAEETRFANLLKYMVEHDGLTEEKVPMNWRCGHNSKVIGLLTGETKPTLAKIRNHLMHGAPFDDPRGGPP